MIVYTVCMIILLGILVFSLHGLIDAIKKENKKTIKGYYLFVFIYDLIMIIFISITR